MSDFRVGDKVRFVFDGTVQKIDKGGSQEILAEDVEGDLWWISDSDADRHRWTLVERATPVWQDGDVVLDREDGKDYRYHRLGGGWYTEKGHRLGMCDPHPGCILVIRNGKPVE